MMLHIVHSSFGHHGNRKAAADDVNALQPDAEKSRSAGNPTFRQTKRTIRRWLCAKEQLLNWLKLEIFGTRRDPQAMTPPPRVRPFISLARLSDGIRSAGEI
jgi:hypothetical protein